MSDRPAFFSRLVLGILVGLYRQRSYRIEGRHPGVAKCVILGAPHTSNWDFVFFLGATRALGIRPAFMGKHTLFKGPLARFMRDMGGVPVDRSRRANYVEQVVAEFARRDELALVIAPEGSRGSRGNWKTGFYHIARGAGVPLVPAWVDQKRRIGGLGEPIWPSGDYDADLAELAAFYRTKRPDCARFDVMLDSATQSAESGRSEP